MTAETRAQEIADAIRSVSFPYEVAIGNAVVRLSRPRKAGPRAVSFRAVVKVNGKVIDRDEHVIVNPPTLIADDNGAVQRVFTQNDGSETIKRFRFDPMAVVVQVVLEAALSKATK